MFSDLPKVLILGAIAAASAFVVTILIVLAALRQSKLNSMSKSDTRLHDMHRLPCNANGERDRQI
uniref:Uncharacterized protein n=1 Tax=Sinocyclocheilus anshuiensis TaxID=1608454 RepID=A0A671KJ85_9TELE